MHHTCMSASHIHPCLKQNVLHYQLLEQWSTMQKNLQYNLPNKAAFAINESAATLERPGGLALCESAWSLPPVCIANRIARD
jgi:hypothetical protein